MDDNDMKNLILQIQRLEMDQRGKDSFEWLASSLEMLYNRWKDNCRNADDRCILDRIVASRLFFHAEDYGRSVDEREVFFKRLATAGFGSTDEQANAMVIRFCYLRDAGQQDQASEQLSQLALLSRTINCDGSKETKQFIQDVVKRLQGESK